MSRAGAVLGLAGRNSVRTPGRLVVLVLLLTTGLVATSTASLAQAGLCRRAVESVTSRTLPGNFNAVVWLGELTWLPARFHQQLTRSVGFGYRDPIRDYIAGYCDEFTWSGGTVRVVRPLASGKYPDPEKSWFSEIRGRYPEAPEEVAVPAPLAELRGLEPGATLTLTPAGGGESRAFVVSGIYAPSGTGSFYDYLLSIPPPSGEFRVNWLVGWVSEHAANVMRSWGPGAEVTIFENPRVRMAELAEIVYGTGSKTAGLGFGLVGVALLIVLLVVLAERQREAAACKIVGMTGSAVVTVLGAELALAWAVAVAAAAPVYWVIASTIMPDILEAAGMSLIAGPFGTSVLKMAVIVALSAAYPFALTSVGTPNQLLSRQKIHLFRRKQWLRRWAEIETE